MVGQTIAERLCETKSLAARHILQDEAALVGAQGVVNERLEARLAVEDARELQAMFAARDHGRAYDFTICPKGEDHCLRDECGTATRLESRSGHAEWLRGMAVVSPSDELELSTISG